MVVDSAVLDLIAVSASIIKPAIIAALIVGRAALLAQLGRPCAVVYFALASGHTPVRACNNLSSSFSIHLSAQPEARSLQMAADSACGLIVERGSSTCPVALALVPALSAASRPQRLL